LCDTQINVQGKTVVAYRVDVDWVVDCALETCLWTDKTVRKTLIAKKNCSWNDITKNMQKVIDNHKRGVVIKEEPVALEVKNLDPYEAEVQVKIAKDGGNSCWMSLGFAKTQVVLGDACYHGSIHYQRSLEKMTNSSFQKSDFLLTTSKNLKPMKLKRQEKHYGVIVQTVGCATTAVCDIPKPIDGCNFDLPISVETELWNCHKGNMTNLLAAIGHLDEEMEIAMNMTELVKNGYEFLNTPDRDELSMQMTQLSMAGYECFSFSDLTNDHLMELVKRLALPTIVTTTMPLGEGCKYGHVFGICPYKTKSDDVQFAIIDGAHPELKPISLSECNLKWCVSGLEPSSLKYTGFAFMPGKKRSRRLIRGWLKSDTNTHVSVGKLDLINKQALERQSMRSFAVCLWRKDTHTGTLFPSNTISASLEHYRMSYKDFMSEIPAQRKRKKKKQKRIMETSNF